MKQYSTILHMYRWFQRIIKRGLCRTCTVTTDNYMNSVILGLGLGQHVLIRWARPLSIIRRNHLYIRLYKHACILHACSIPSTTPKMDLFTCMRLHACKFIYDAYLWKTLCITMQEMVILSRFEICIQCTWNGRCCKQYGSRHHCSVTLQASRQ